MKPIVFCLFAATLLSGCANQHYQKRSQFNAHSQSVPAAAYQSKGYTHGIPRKQYNHQGFEDDKSYHTPHAWVEY